MSRMPLSIIATWLFAALPTAHAQAASDSPFQPGSFLPEYGLIAEVPGAAPLPAETEFKVSYDITRAGQSGELNRSIVTAARFLNMHTAAGVDPERISLALVLHGPSVRDVTAERSYREDNSVDNANAPLIAALLEHGVRVIVCGQSAAAQGIVMDDLLPGVEMYLSAMTAHALLQQDGYTLNPF